MAFTLRDYQDDAVLQVRTAYKNGKRYVLLVLATGAGKTVIFSFIAKTSSDNGKRVLILAHRDQLIKQASRKLHDYGVEHGVIMPGFTPNYQANVQVASIQTMVRRMHKLKLKFDLIVIDEAHLSAANTYRRILAHYPGARVLGVTGSPCRLDNKPLGIKQGGIYDEMVQGVSICDLIERGFLMRPVVYAPREQLDLSGVAKSGGDYDTQQLAAVVDTPTITGDAVKMYRKICPGVPAVAWCVDIKHAQNVADAFNAAGVPAMMLCGDHDSDYRDRALAALESGKIKVLTFVGILIEGVDCPAIGAVILLRPSMSLSSYLQVVGRGLRPFTYPSGLVKTVCYVLDHCGLTFRHGFVDDEDREWSLEEGVVKKRKPGEKEPRVDAIQCQTCFTVFTSADAKARAKTILETTGVPRDPCCPRCDVPIKVKTRKVEVIEGEISHITKEMVQAQKRKKMAEVKKAKTKDDLRRIAKERGYAPGWVECQWQAKQKARERFTKAKAPPAPSIAELKAMTLDQLETVAQQQGWPSDWAANFFNTTHRAA